MNKYIIIEGADGTGKSTLAKSLASAIHAELIHEPSAKPDFSNLNAIHSVKEEAVTYYFAWDNIKVLSRVQSMLELSDVVSDRSALSNLAYRDFHGLSDTQLAAVSNVVQSRLTALQAMRPLLILLLAPEDVLSERITKRSEATGVPETYNWRKANAVYRHISLVLERCGNVYQLMIASGTPICFTFEPSDFLILDATLSTTELLLRSLLWLRHKEVL